MSKSKEEVKKALHRLDAIVNFLPEDVDILSIDIPGRINGREFEATIFLYPADLEAIKENYNMSRVHEEGMRGYTTSYQYFTVEDIAVFRLIERAAALSGTEDSGNEKDVT